MMNPRQKAATSLNTDDVNDGAQTNDKKNGGKKGEMTTCEKAEKIKED